MLLTIRVSDRVFEIWIGYKTHWFEQSHFISFFELFEDKNEKVQDAVVLLQLFQSREYKERTRYKRG